MSGPWTVLRALVLTELRDSSRELRRMATQSAQRALGTLGVRRKRNELRDAMSKTARAEIERSGRS